jgi:hypothetical protein
MTDPTTALIWFIAATAMVISVIGTGIIFSVKASNATRHSGHRPQH